jgi:Tol biopolymer transport system component
MSILDTRTQKHDLWIRDVKRGTQTRFTFDPGDDIWPTWSENGDSLAFGSDRSGSYRIFIKPASGLSPEVELPNQGPGNRGPIQWMSSRGLLTAQNIGSGGVWQSFVIPLADPAHVIPIASSEKFDIEAPRISPDGRFVVYSNDESGTAELFVQPFPTATGRWQITSTGGRRGYWTKGGAEIVNRNTSGMIVATPIAVTPEGSINAGAPATLFSVSQVPTGNLFRWVPSADGGTFYVAEPASASLGHVTPITVILNVNTELGGK